MVPKLQIYTQVEPLQLGSLKFDEFDWKLFKKISRNGGGSKKITCLFGLFTNSVHGNRNKLIWYD